MQAEIDTIKIQMTIREAREFSRQMRNLFDHFNGAVNAVGMTSIEQLMLDYPSVSEFFNLIKVLEIESKDPIW